MKKQIFLLSALGLFSVIGIEGKPDNQNTTKSSDHKKTELPKRYDKDLTAREKREKRNRDRERKKDMKHVAGYAKGKPQSGDVHPRPRCVKHRN